MADNYTKFSEVIEYLTEEESKWWEIILNPNSIPNPIRKKCEDAPDDQWPPFDYVLEDEGTTLWFKSEAYGNVAVLARVVQEFLKVYRPNDFFSLAHAETCSRPRVGEFGGGAVFVTAKKIRYMHAWTWAALQRIKFKAKK